MKASIAVGVLGLATAAWCQPQKTLTARELFYTPVATAKATPPAAKAAPAPKRATPPAGTTQTASAPAERPLPPASSEPVVVPVMNAGLTASDRPPLGLRYSVLKLSDNGGYNEVDPETVFRSGDKIRVIVESNDVGYLYVVLRGSSGTWKPLFPSSDVADGDNRIVRGRRYEIPPGGRFIFDEQAGTERVFVVLSRQPEPSLEKLIYALSSGGGTVKPVEGDKPVRKQIYMAANMTPIDDTLVGRLRSQMLARDLVFEKVTETSPGEKKEKAVYVVNQNAGPESRLIVDLNLKHQ